MDGPWRGGRRHRSVGLGSTPNQAPVEPASRGLTMLATTDLSFRFEPGLKGQHRSKLPLFGCRRSRVRFRIHKDSLEHPIPSSKIAVVDNGVVTLSLGCHVGFDPLR